jgi:hypothetical protein
VVHLVEIDKNFRDIKDIKVPVSELIEFVKNLSGMKKKQDIIKSITEYADRTNRDVISLNILNNLIVNYEAGAGSIGVKLTNFFVSKGADANLEPQSGGEFWLVVFNPKIIKKVSIVDPKMVDGNFAFMLPKIGKISQ